MKRLWRLAMGSEALWAQQLREKYLPRSELWHSKRGSRCTIFWRALLALRDHLQEIVTWQLGDGEVCKIFAQPWFSQALSHLPQSREDRIAMVNQLVDPESGQWRVDLIAGRFGYSAALTIISNVRPPGPGRGSDRLIFTLTSDGNYSVKKAYVFLMQRLGPAQRHGQQQVNADLARLWKHIWREGELPPRLRVFLWKLAHGAVPLGKIMSDRIHRGDPRCQMCGQSDEDALHLAFLCPFSRGCWLAGRLAIRTDGFTSSIQNSLLMLVKLVPPELWQEVVMSLWSIWRCRNNLVFQGKIPSFADFAHFNNQIRVENMLASSRAKMSNPIQGMVPLSTTGALSSTICHIDGSWSFGWIGGMGFIFHTNGALVVYKTARTMACCPIQAEAIALKLATDYAILEGISNCQFLTDCQSLIDACTATNPPSEVDWRASKEIFHIWKVLKCHEGFACSFVSRGQNMIADELAKRGRILGEEYVGFSYPMFPPGPF